MINITNPHDITAAMEQFQPHPDGAFPTGRTLPGQSEQANCQEWQENGAIHGKPARVLYLFGNHECESEDASEYPFDSDHVARIEIDA
jgi:hypothetical protein